MLKSNHDKILDSTDCGLILEGTDKTTFIENAKIKGNAYGLYQANWGTIDPVISSFEDCDLRGNLDYDVIQDPYYGSVVLNFQKVKYTTYYLYPGGSGTATLNTSKYHGHDHD